MGFSIINQPLWGTPIDGHPHIGLAVPGRMAPGSYELTFGDERQTQSTVGFFDGRMGTRKWRKFYIWKIMDIYALYLMPNALIGFQDVPSKTKPWVAGGDAEYAVSI